MKDLERRIARLSASKRALLELGLRSVRGERPAASAAMTVAELGARATLDPAIRASGSPDIERASRPRAVLLTGATGFLGAFLLEALAAATDAEIHCLVRAASATEAQERVRRNLLAYGLDGSLAAQRVVPVAGDLGRPLLGLGTSEFGELAASVDAVYHCGAMVKWTYPFRALEAANVDGTREMLRLATLGRPLPFHFVSTVGVFASLDRAEDVILESEPLERSGPLAVGYAQTKWVAERLVRKAAERGLPVSVYRPSTSGDSRTGAFNRQDHVCLVLKGCIALGSAPQSELPVQVAPVDYVARALVAVSLRPGLPGGTYHLVNPASSSWSELFDLVRARGYSLRPASYAEWIDRIEAEVLTGTDNPLAGLLPFLQSSLSASALPRFDCAETRAGLAGMGISCPPLDERLLDIYFAELVRSGFVGPPTVKRASAWRPDAVLSSDPRSTW